MDPKHFTLMLFCGYLTNTVLTETQSYSSIVSTQTTFKSSKADTTANFRNGTENPLSQSLQVANSPSKEPLAISTSSSKATTSPVPGSPGQLPASTVPTAISKSSGQTPGSPDPTFSNQPVASDIFNFTRQSPGSPISNSSSQSPESTVSNSSRQSPASSVFTSTMQPSVTPDHSSSETTPITSIQSSAKKLPVTSNHSSSKKPSTSSGPSSRQSVSTVVTPGFIKENDSSPQKPQSSKTYSVAGVLIGTVLTLMIIAILIIFLWKCLRKSTPSDQNWAGRSPFADGETLDMCLEYSRENGNSTKRSSIVSLEIWKPNKSMLLADDVDVKTFDSIENVDEDPKSDIEKMKDKSNGASEESADRWTVGTTVSSSSEEKEVTPDPPLLDLDGPEHQESNLPDVIENDFPHPPAMLDSEDRQSSLSDSTVLPTPSEALAKDQEECNSADKSLDPSITETQFPIPPDCSQQEWDESLPPLPPPPPEELL